MADQVAVPATPQVADITIPTDAPKPDMENINQAMDAVAKQLQAPLPSHYTQGAIPAEPHLKPVQHVEDSQRVQPMNNTAMAYKSARTANGISGILGLVGKTSERFQQNKQDQLKTKLVDVMQSKQQIENAKKVLAQDPDNQMARSVLKANTEKLQAILSDPKNEKQLKKALDISYVDLDKNKTPEVAAAIAAEKEVKSAGAFNAANPQEAEVAQMAQAPPKFAAPPPPNVRSTTGTPEVMQANPRAAAAMAKDTPTLEPNPQYAVQLQQKETAQKQLMALAPHYIDAKAKAELAQYILPEIRLLDCSIKLQVICKWSHTRPRHKRIGLRRVIKRLYSVCMRKALIRFVLLWLAREQRWEFLVTHDLMLRRRRRLDKHRYQR